MADESLEHRNPSATRSGQLPGDAARDESGQSSSRRRIVIASLLAPPAVMTVGARLARAKQPKDSPSCAASLNPSHHCT